MAKYRIKRNSVSFDGQKTSMIIQFNGGDEEYYEIPSGDPQHIERVLKRVTLAQAEAHSNEPAPRLTEGVDVTVTAEAR